jgi:hypothetical protein
MEPTGGGRGRDKQGDMIGFPNRRVMTRVFRPSTSPLIVTSILAPLVGGPVGSVAAIVFGWAARHEPLEVTSPRRRFLALVGMALGLVCTFLWAAVMSYVAISLERNMHATHDEAGIEPEHAANVIAVPTGSSKADAGNDAPARVIPKVTTTRREGVVTVVDIGASVSSLSQEIAKERAEASRVGELTLVMTIRGDCDACQRFSETLSDPLMQTALSRVRIVRIDVDVFEEDLPSMKIPSDKLPGFYLLAPDLIPRDGIDGSEWGSDRPTNMAPVLGAFVRGKYANRRRSWQPVSDNGIRL